MNIKNTWLMTISGLALVGAVSTAHAEEIVVGGKNYTEAQIMASMTTQYLTSLGYEVNERTGMGGAILRKAQVNGQIDVYWEYTGTALINYNDVTDKLSPEEAYERVKQLDADKGLVWLDRSEVNNTYAIAMREADAEQRGIDSISGLAEAVNSGEALTFASSAEFYSREDGLRPMQKAYEFSFGRRNVKPMDSGLIYNALRDERVDASLVFATDGRVPAFNFRVLEDDKDFFTSYSMAPVVRKETLEENPQLGDQLEEISLLLDDDIMSRMNARVDVDGMAIESVANNFLKENQLL